jgi:uncharacterized protein DUF3563
MNRKTLWDERLGMLMACGSPGSALAYHLGQTTFQTEMVQRTTGGAARESDDTRPDRLSASSATSSFEAGGDTGREVSLAGWFTRAWRRLEAWSWQRGVREREAYLAKAKDLVDLEARMRNLDGDAFLSRARSLY